jgi:CDP-diacylglycerol--glycerol-3-phosphate 3-phosphatidyltransferase
MNIEKWEIPNILSVIRIPMALACTYYAFLNTRESLIISFVIFFIAAFTDYIDGYLARKWNIVSDFGKIVDPIADKILILGLFLAFSLNAIFPLYVTIIIAVREIGLTIIRLLLLPKKVVLYSRYSGKIKTFSQVMFLVILYCLLIFTKQFEGVVSFEYIQLIIYGLLIWIIFITLYSGYEFFVANRTSVKKLF